MDFWNKRESSDEASRSDTESEPTFLDKLKDYAKEEAMAKVVETLSGGWVTMEYEDEDEPQQCKRDDDAGTFEERIQRRLAELQEQAAALPEVPVDPAPSVDVPPVDAPVAPLQRPAPRPPQRGPGGFGRKGL
ncbi:MAG: hypothetical protein EAY70_13015 [Sphingomonadales bacterium]|nr:MAG: hypothetical protein EAY70_13015 [Sphingomonadales bacterium]